MDDIARWLSAVVPKVKTPLTLAALMLVILYAVISQLLRMNVFSTVDGASTYRLLARVLDIMLYLGMTCVILATACYVLNSSLQRRSRKRSSVELIDASIERPTMPKRKSSREK